MSGPRAALFDLDGTLVNSEPRSIWTWSRLLDAHGIPYDDALLRRFMGRRGADVIAEDPALFPGVPWDELVKELAEIGTSPDVPAVEMMPRSAEFVRGLGAAGVPIALVTSAGPVWAESALRKAGIDAWFTGAITAADVTRGKPDPEGYLAGARMLGAEPEHTTVFEDTPAGVEAGRRAGMRVVAITTTHPGEHLRAADVVVDHLTEVDWDALGGTGAGTAGTVPAE